MAPFHCKTYRTECNELGTIESILVHGYECGEEGDRERGRETERETKWE